MPDRTLGGIGLASDRKQLAEMETRLGARPADRWNADHSHERFTLGWNAKRLFALLTLKEPDLAWTLAHSLALVCDHTWAQLMKAYEKVDPIATQPIHQRLGENELVWGQALPTVLGCSKSSTGQGCPNYCEWVFCRSSSLSYPQVGR